MIKTTIQSGGGILDTHKNSQKKMNDLQHELYQFSNKVEDMYYTMRRELMDEIIAKEKDHIKEKNELYDIYNQLTEEDRIHFIKKKLPWHMTIFRKINCYSYGLQDTTIFLEVAVGKKRDICYVTLGLEDFK